MAREQRLPTWMRADASFGALHAYYRYVCGAEVWFPRDDRRYCAVEARSDDAYFGADFSTHYGFPNAMKQSRARERLEERARHLVDFSEFAADGRPTVFEVWCFIPPSEQLLAAAVAARMPEGCTFRLLHGEEFRGRIRAAALAVPEEELLGEGEPETAFDDCAQLFRLAFGLGRGTP